MSKDNEQREPIRIEIKMTSATFMGSVTKYLDKRYNEWTHNKNLRGSGMKQELPGGHYWSVRIW